MGCFSFLCQKSGKPIASSSFDGDACRLYLLKDGLVIEEMRGHYDSYGRVFDSNGKSFEWHTPWGVVCDLMFNYSENDGIAAVLECYFDDVIPTIQSESDPDQGWGDSNGKDIKIDKPYHKVFSTIESINRDKKLEKLISDEDNDKLSKLIAKTEKALNDLKNK